MPWQGRLISFDIYILSMKRIGIVVVMVFFYVVAYSQDTTTENSIAKNPFIHKDDRIDILGQKMAEYNESLAKKIKLVDGYRLMLLNTSDRALAMNVRTKILQFFPDQKLYTAFLSPYIKLKLGNFLDKAEAEKIRKQIVDLKIITGNIYILNEKVEQKPTEKKAGNGEE